MRCRAVSCFAVLSLSYIPDDNTINSKHAELARASVYVLEHFIQKPSFSFFSCCTGTYTATNSSTARSSMYVYIRVWMSLNREHSKAQHSTAQSPLHKSGNQVCADQSTYQKKCVDTCSFVPFVFLHDGALGILQVACLHFKCWTSTIVLLRTSASAIPIHASL